MSSTPYFLLDATIDGRPFRWSTTRVEIDGVVYEAGLGDLTVELGTESVSVSVVDPSVDWPTLAPKADGGSAVLRRWLTGRALADAVTLCSGELRVGSWGARDDPFQATIYRTAGPSLGTQVPDVTAQVSGDTWPLTAPGPSGVAVVDLGRSYPIIFGFPGYRGILPRVAVVPIPVGQQGDGSLGRPTESQTVPVACEDGTLPITSVLVYNAQSRGSSDETVAFQADARLHGIRIVQFASGASSWPDPADGTPALFAGFSPSGGGGPRSAYEVLTYGLRRWGQDSADWSRLPEVRDLLERYLVDTWISDPEPSFWDWFRAVLLPDLPVEIRSSDRGLYLVEQRWRSDPRRVIGALDIDAGQGALLGPVVLSDTGPYNEFVGNFGADRDHTYAGQVLVTGREGVLSSQRIGATLAAGIVLSTFTAIRSSLCSASAARYGARPATPLDLDWTGDEGTVAAVLTWQAERDALPARIVSYEISTSGLNPREGDELLLTDTARGFVGVPAIVTTPPVYSAATTSVDLRIPPTP